MNVAEISLETVVGGGSSGDVHSGEYRGMRVAVKTPRPNMYELETLQAFANEVHLMSRLRHRMIRFIGCAVPAARDHRDIAPARSRTCCAGAAPSSTGARRSVQEARGRSGSRAA